MFLFAARLFRPFGAGYVFMSAAHGLRSGLQSYAALRLFVLVCLSAAHSSLHFKSLAMAHPRRPLRSGVRTYARSRTGSGFYRFDFHRLL